MPPPAVGSGVSDRLYFGRSIPDGGEVTDAEWETFVRDVVTPRFPDGLTIYRAEGQWSDKGVLTREPVMVIEILHAPSRELDRLIGEIANTYRERFRQSAVLRVTMPARTEFID